MRSGIAKRLRKSLESFFTDDLEDSLYQISSAIDATAKKRYPTKKPSLRVQLLLKDEQDLIYGLSTQGRMNVHPNGKVIYPDGELQRIIYKYIRCGQAHEAEPDLSKITLGGEFGVGRTTLEGASTMLEGGKYLISKATVMALIFSVICAPENAKLDLRGMRISFLTEKNLDISKYLGNKESFITFYKGLFGQRKPATRNTDQS